MVISGILNAINTLLSDIFYEINSRLQPIHNALDSSNIVFDKTLPWVVIAAFLGYDIFYYIKNKNKRDVLRLEFILIILEILAILAFWFFPKALFVRAGIEQGPVVFRWGIIILSSLGITYVYGHEHGERRWFYSLIGHLAAFLAGWWLFNRWVGIIFFSIPLLAVYYLSLYILAMVAIPASNPENKKERWKRFLVLASYTWGVQFPILVVADHAWKKAETRIKGDFARDLPFPGLIWTKSHHVVGLTGGTQFNRVAGPGVIFTGKLEQPLEIIDLRLQLRTNEIEVVSKDGIKFIVRVFTAFRMDPETWNNKIHAQLRAMNPVLQDANLPSYTTGSFPFSHRRIQAALGTTSVKTMEPDKVLPWDKWVLNIVDEEARKVVAQKTLDELWRPKNDKKFANPMSALAQEIKDSVALTIRSRGILLVVARIVNFRFVPAEEGKMDEISEQQIAAWAANWKRKRAQKLTDAEVSAEYDQREARAYAELLLLNSIAEALQKTRDINPDLPKHVIAMRYLSALQDYAHKNSPEEEGKIKEWHDYFKE